MKNGITQLACLSTLLEHMDLDPSKLEIPRALELLQAIRWNFNHQMNEQNSELLNKDVKDDVEVKTDK